MVGAEVFFLIMNFSAPSKQSYQLQMNYLIGKYLLQVIVVNL